MTRARKVCFNSLMYPKRTEKLPWREIDGRAVVIQPGAGKVHDLNEVGALLWTLADGSRTFDQIIDTVVERFDIQPAQARMDAREFYEGLEELGLVKIEADPRVDSR